MPKQSQGSMALVQLESWYTAQCDEEWEHSYGISIATLDNPGWSLKIDLAGTSLDERTFVEYSDLEPDDEWMTCKVEDRTFIAHCGPRMLLLTIQRFLDWAQTTSDGAE